MSSQTIPTTMKAIRIEKTGDFDQLVMREIPVPTPKDDEVLIKVEYTGVNFIDNYFRTGLYPKPTPYTVGTDSVGTIVHTPTMSSALPSGLSPPAVGTRVMTGIADAFAEYQVAPWWKLMPLPASLKEKPEEGPAAGTTAFTAMYLVKESHEVKKGEWVLVRAASGGVGVLLCQLCKKIGANVIGTVSSPAKAELAKQSGADHVLFTSDPSEDNVKRILELSEGKGVHAIFDGIGKDTWEEDFLVIRPKGSLITFGNASGPVPPVSPLKLSPKCIKLSRPTLGPFISTPEDYAKYSKWITEAIDGGALKFTVHKVYDFSEEDVRQAMRDITSGKTQGKLVIKVA